MPNAGRAVAGIWLSLALCGAARLDAQGVTGAAIQGVVTSEDSSGIKDATVLVTNIATGERWQTTSGSNGRFFVEHLSVGGPYRIEIRAIGYAPARQEGIFLALGERHTASFSLRPAAVELAELTVQAAVDSRINPGRTGPAQLISDSTILRLASPRDYTSVAQLAPQVNVGFSAISFAGQPDRLNGFQVDGTNNSDLFNGMFTGNGTMAGFPDDRTAPTPEDIADVEVLSAPFDVRYGNFAAGMINAVTKSGSNHLAGVVYGFFENQDLTGKDITGGRPTDFGQGEAGLSLAGPIVRDRLAFFVDASFRRRRDAQPVPDPGVDTTGGADSAGVGIRHASVVRFEDILRNRYATDPGDFQGQDHQTPSGNVFAKLTAQLGVNSRLEISHNYFYGAFDFAGIHDYGFLQFTSMAGHLPVTVNATRLNWTTALGVGWTNELLLGRSHEANECTPRSPLPRVEARADAGSVEAGSAPGCGRSKDAETIWELTDNLGLIRGPHHWTFGMHHELLRLESALRAPDEGAWLFDSLDSLEQGTASLYERILPGPLAPEGPRLDFPVRQVGFYLQDQWTPTPRLTLTAGMRLDVPFLPTPPPQNPDLLARFGINTAVTPTGHALWSPRLGMSYDLSGRGNSFLRGGIGLFAGRPAYIWFREAFFGTGLQQINLLCEGNAVPPFTLDPAQQPTTCAGFQEGTPLVTYFNPDFRYPRSLKITIGGDRRLPWGMVGTVDLLYARAVSQFAERDVNLLPPAGVAAGEHGRALYGVIDPATGFAEPNRQDSTYGPVIEMFNRSGDRSWSLALQIQKRFPQGTELGVAYTYTDARDRQSLPLDGAFDNLSASPLDGTWEDPSLRNSIYSRPHKVTLTGTFNLPFKFQLGLFYLAFSGEPLTYTVLGDANGDGIDNDPVYLPKNAGDITLENPADYPRLDSIIRRESCLQQQRGRLLERNSCRQPGISTLDARLTKVLPTTRGQALALTVDCFNLLNLLDHDWGQVRSTSDGYGGLAQARLLQLVGYDVQHGRGVYNVLVPNFGEVNLAESRWRLRFSARYTF